tara:strand:- start:693 stop:1106 length:414 start_codon:yes stop_codon:yes gene_type:complete
MEVRKIEKEKTDLRRREYKLIFYDVPPAEIRGNTRAHWRTMRRINRERRDTAKWLTIDAIGTIDFIPMEKAEVFYHFYNSREIDLDNLIYGMKSTLDGIVDSGILIDDKPSNMELRVKFTKSDKQNIKTLVYIKEIE